MPSTSIKCMISSRFDYAQYSELVAWLVTSHLDYPKFVPGSDPVEDRGVPDNAAQLVIVHAVQVAPGKHTPWHHLQDKVRSIGLLLLLLILFSLLLILLIIM